MQLIAEARKLVGKPFVHQGRSIYGLDCLGTLYVAAKNAGVESLVKKIDASTKWDYNYLPQFDLESIVRKIMTRVVGKPVPGSVVFFKFYKIEHPQHLAIYTDTNTLIHALTTNQKVCEHGYSPPWPDYVHSIWKIEDVDYGQVA